MMENRFRRLGSIVCTLLLAMSLGACSNQDVVKDKTFVGKWHSSKTLAPIQLHESGEWELLSNDGGIIQYGVWQYFDNKLMWSVMSNGAPIHEVNLVLSANSKEFKLRERDASVTVFSKLN